MDMISFRRSLAGVTLVAASVCPWGAQATELAEFSWSGRFGSGSIVYDRDALDAVDAEGRGSFLNAIRSFDVGGIKLPYGSGYIELHGDTGSILSINKPEACGGHSCDWSSVSFLLGASHDGDPLHYKLTVRMPFLLDDDDLIPIGEDPDGMLPGGIPDESDYRRVISGSISNEFNSPSGNYIAMGWGSVYNRLLPAPPVPEPATVAMFALGAGLLGWARRRRI